MSIVSLCAILIEVPDRGLLVPSLTFVASCYGEMSSRRERKGENVPVQASATTLRGKRPLKTYNIETYNSSEPTDFVVAHMAEPNPGRSAGGDDNISRDASKCGASDVSIPQTELKNYFSGNPFVEVTKGVLHLYKDNEKSVLDDRYPGRSPMLCMLAVPTFLSCTDVLQFLAPFHRDIHHIKVIRETVPNQYMILLKFRTQEGADNCYREMNGKNFNSFEDDHCHLAFVSRVETLKESDSGGVPLTGHTELPTCPVCLERMDESVDGILTILCNHSFHSTCLSKWSDSSCPVCRYVQTPEMVASNQCAECGSSESLWVCLICGHIGCGRYVHGHAYKHFCETQHTYAIQPDNNRVWDYIGDSFVHRLLQNKGDGKVVEVSGRAHYRDDKSEDGGGEEKVDAMQMEFTYLLTSQLQSQRHFFETRLSSAEKDMQTRIDFLMGKMELIETDRQSLELKIGTLQKEKLSLEKKLTQMSQKLAKAISDLKEEKEFNKCLENDQKLWKEKVAKLEQERVEFERKTKAEIADKDEQIRDYMFYFESKTKIENSEFKDEIAGGQVCVDESSIPTTSKKARKKKNK